MVPGRKSALNFRAFVLFTFVQIPDQNKNNCQEKRKFSTVFKYLSGNSFCQTDIDWNVGAKIQSTLKSDPSIGEFFI